MQPAPDAAEPSDGARPPPASEANGRDLARFLPWAVIGAASLAYGVTASRVVLGGDNGELCAVGAAGGVAHPPGYPLYILWLRAWSWLPAASPAHRVALATAILGAATLAVLYRACRAWGADVAAASLVVAAFAFSPRAWIAATQGEVFALNALLAAGILFVAAADRPRGLRRVAALGLLAGLGLSNHHTIVLLAPIGVCGAVRGVRESHARVASIAAGLAGLALGLLPYLYVVACARHPDGRVIWGDPSDAQRLLAHFLRRQYGTASLGLHRTASSPLAQVALLLRDLLRDLLGLPLLALVAAFAIRRGARPRATPSRTAWLLLVVSFLLAGVLFVTRFPLTTEGLDRLVVERFHLLPLVVLAPIVAVGIDLAAGTLLHRRAVAIGCVGAFVAIGALFSIVDVEEHHDGGVERWMHDTLAMVPERAVIIGTGDHRLGAMLYARSALSERLDVDYVDAALLLDESYRLRASARLGVELAGPDEGGSLSTPTIASQLLATGRPLFLADVFSNSIQAAFPTYPIGTLIRVLPVGSALPDPPTLARMNEEALARFDVLAEPPRVGTWEGDLRASYVRPWLVLEQAFGASGDSAAAVACHAHAAALEARSGD